MLQLLASLTGQVTMHFVSNPRNHFLHVIIVIPLLNSSDIRYSYHIILLAMPQTIK